MYTKWFLLNVCTFIILCLLSCKKEKYNNTNKLFNPYGNKAVLEICNKECKPAIFSLNINNQFPLTEEKIINSIKYWADSLQLPLHVAAWKYVSEITKHDTPPTEQLWIHNPEIFINSIGTGYCDDRATILAKLWQKLGYETRIYGLNGHVVPEVLADSKWQMYDPDHEIYYLNNNVEVASVNELENNPQYFFNVDYADIDELSDININSEFLMQKYATKEDNELNDFYLTEADSNISLVFEMPPHSKMQFPKYIPYNIGLFYTTTKAVELTLYRSEKTQTIKLPFIIYAIEENKTVIYKRANNDSNEIFEKSFEANSIKDSIKIYCLLNPRLEIFKEDTNNITILSEKQTNLHCSFYKAVENERYKQFILENSPLIYSNKYKVKEPFFENFETMYINLLNDMEKEYMIDLREEKENAYNQVLSVKQTFLSDSAMFMAKQHYQPENYIFLYLKCLNNLGNNVLVQSKNISAKGK